MTERLGIVAAGILCYLAAPAANATAIDFDGTEQLISGSDCETGARYRFGTTNIIGGKSLDLIVEIVDEQNDYRPAAGSKYKCLGLLEDDPGDPRLFSVIGTDGADNGDSTEPWWIDLKFQFVEKGSGAPVTLDRVTLTSFDLDTNSQHTVGADLIYLTSSGTPTLSENSLLTLLPVDIVTANATYDKIVAGTSDKDCAPETDPDCLASIGYRQTTGFQLRLENNKSAENTPRLFQFEFAYEDTSERTTTNPIDPGEIRTGLDGGGSLGFALAPMIGLAWRRHRKSGCNAKKVTIQRIVHKTR